MFVGFNKVQKASKGLIMSQSHFNSAVLVGEVEKKGRLHMSMHMRHNDQHHFSLVTTSDSLKGKKKKVM